MKKLILIFILMFISSFILLSLISCISSFNISPIKPYSPKPSNGSLNVSRTPTLSWKCSDPNGDSLKYDIYFGQDEEIILVKSGYDLTNYQITTKLRNGEYYNWKIIAKDDLGLTSEGPLWTFKTENKPPVFSSNPSPTNGATNLNIDITFEWTCNDVEKDKIVYDFYLGTSTLLTPKVTHIKETSLTISNLDYETEYKWQIIAKDEKGGKSESPIWTFVTKEKSFNPALSKLFGGSNNDLPFSIRQANDGGYFIGGYTGSYDGDVSNFHGRRDYWIVKTDRLLNIEWQKCLGGSEYDSLYDICLDDHDNCVVTGTTNSNDGDVSNFHGRSDYWVAKLKSDGTLLWQKCFGGTNVDSAQCIQQTNDGGYIVAGWSTSNDEDVTKNNGASDYWIVKLDDQVNLQWEKSYGGSNSDLAQEIKQTNDGGYIVVGYTNSNDGDVTENMGQHDFWLIKLNEQGNLQWQSTFGGSYDDSAKSVVQTNDGGYVIVGSTHSNNGDVFGNHGQGDLWIVKIDGLLNIEWQKCYGGSANDYANSVQCTSDGGYIVVGSTRSIDGDIKGFHGGVDYWILKLSKDGNIQWQKCLGGSDYDVARSIQQTTDGRYIVAGSSKSIDGDVIGEAHGNYDYWILKLEKTKTN